MYGNIVDTILTKISTYSHEDLNVFSRRSQLYIIRIFFSSFFSHSPFHLNFFSFNYLFFSHHDNNHSHLFAVFHLCHTTIFCSSQIPSSSFSFSFNLFVCTFNRIRDCWCFFSPFCFLKAHFINVKEFAELDY